MSDMTNLILMAFFLGMDGYFIYRFFRTRKYIKVVDRFPTFIYVMMSLLFFSILITMLFDPMNNMLSYVRSGLMLLLVVMFFLARDGIGDEGIVVSGRFIPYSDIKGWDYEEDKKVFRTYYSLGDNNFRTVSFELKNKDAVLELLKEHIQKKYMRMRKS